MARRFLSLFSAATPRWLLSEERASGLILILATGIAVGLANSPMAPAYEAFRSWTFGPTFEPELQKSLRGWVNEGLMALFFMAVGLEIKREMLDGVLSHPKRAVMTIAAAFGGMAVPIAIYASLNLGGAGARGWAIPMATDIAFVIGLLALIEQPGLLPLKVFLTAVAILDDIGSVLVIAVFYGHTINLAYLIGAAILVAAAAFYGATGRSHPLALGLFGVGLWYLVMHSGIHATIAGVLVALTVPLRGPNGETAPIEHYEEVLTPWVLFGVMPAFALLNAGVAIRMDSAWFGAIPLGIMIGLLLGKPIGIVSACWLCDRLGIAHLPEGMGWRSLAALGVLAGLGFTMALFIAQLAFAQGAELTQAKGAILASSSVAALFGLLLVHRALRRER